MNRRFLHGGVRQLTMPVCSRCGTQVGVLGLLSFNAQTARCGKCDKQVRGYYDYFRRLFIDYCRDGILSPEEWSHLQDTAPQYQLDRQTALSYVRADALNFIERQLAFAAADGMITHEEEIHIRNWQTV